MTSTSIHSKSTGVRVNRSSHKFSIPEEPINTSLMEYMNRFKKLHGDTSLINDEEHSVSIVDYIVIDDGKNFQIIPEDQAIKLIFLCIAIVKRVIERDISCLYMRKFATSKLDRQIWRPNDYQLLMLIKQLVQQFDNYQIDDYANEHLTCVMEAFNILKPHLADLNLCWNQPNTFIQTIDGLETTIADLLNQFCSKLYELSHSTDFKEAIRARTRRSISHFERGKAYINQLRSENKNLVIVRVDLSLPKGKKQISLDEIKIAFESFLQALRRKSSLDMKGYIWKLEYGAKKSFHYHCLFFLDARKHSFDIKLAQMIGEIWSQKINGQNCYFNCHTDEYTKHLKCKVLGKVASSDDEKYDVLINVMLRYFCKSDQFIVHKSIMNKKTFDTGRTSSVRKHLGRPVTI